MKGKYKAAIALVLVLVLLPLTLLLTLTHWVPTLAGIWLPVGTRISLQESPRLPGALHQLQTFAAVAVGDGCLQFRQRAIPRQDLG